MSGASQAATFLAIAWRNVWRNRRRTALAAGAVAFSVMVTVVVLALSDGSHWAMLRFGLELFSGAAQVQAAPEPAITLPEVLDWPLLLRALGRPPEQGEPSREARLALLAELGRDPLTARADLNRQAPGALAPLADKGFQKDPTVEKCFPAPEALVAALASVSGVRGVAPRVQAGALAASEQGSAGALLVGVDPWREPTVTALPRTVAEGAFLASGDGRVCVLGRRLAQNLRVGLGSSLALITQARDGSTGAGRFTVKGLLSLGVDELDGALVLVPLEEARALLAAEGQAHALVVALDDPEDVAAVVPALGRAAPGLAVLGWPELQPELVQLIQLDDVFGDLFLGIMLLVVVFGVLSAMVSSVLERTPEFGLMLALGTRPRHVLAMVLAETLLLVGVGVAVGLAAGVAIAGYFEAHPVALPASWAGISSYYGAENKLFFMLRARRVVAATLFLVVSAVCLSLWPAWKAAGLQPDRALRALES